VEDPASNSHTPFSRFTELCSELESTPSTNMKEEFIAEFLKGLRREEVEPAVLLLSGRILPETDQKALGVGYQSLKRVYEEEGYGRLVEFGEATILDVHRGLKKIAETSGRDSIDRKRRILVGLYGMTQREDKEYLTRAIAGELRVGAVEGLILGGIARASNVPLREVRRAYMFIGEIGRVAELTLFEGREAMRIVKPRLFNPLRPMLATMAYSVEEALSEVGGEAAVEVKYDGARVQIHLADGRMRIFSRRLTDVTGSLPDIVESVKESVRARRTILEGEIVGIGTDGKPLPFQDLMRRFRRVKDIEDNVARIPVRLYLFEILYVDGSVLIDKSCSERYGILQDTVEGGLIAKRIVISNSEEAIRFYEEALEMGHEGVMVKNLGSPYVLGRRGKHWFKVKATETLDLVILGSDWGYGRRNEWLSDYYLGAYDEESGGFQAVGKTFKGLTDEEFRCMTRELLDLKVSETQHTVWVKPRIVVEVAFDEVQKSPKYPVGYALRLARILRIRRDKPPTEADTTERMKELYEKKLDRKGSISL
jgi:DNA ligase-1